MPKFNRQDRQGWCLAASIECPKCRNKLYGDKTFIWCKSFDCNFFCFWCDKDRFNNENYSYSKWLKGTLKQQGDKVFIQKDCKKFEIILKEIKCQD